MFSWFKRKWKKLFCKKETSSQIQEEIYEEGLSETRLLTSDEMEELERMMRESEKNEKDDSDWYSV